MRCCRILTCLTTPVFVVVSSAAALAQTPATPAPVPESTADVMQAPVAETSERMPGWGDLFKPLKGDFQRLGSRQNLWLVGVGAMGAVTAHTWDAKVASSQWGRGAVGEILEPGKLVGGLLVQTGSAVATYAVGRATGSSRVADIGAKLFRAQVAAQVTTQTIKLSSHRRRPDGTTLSFPSGHTASSFATASVLHAELGWKAGVPAYAVAAWVAASRVQMHRHFVSDVIAGATVGLLAGRSVTVGRGHAKFALSPMVVPGGFGATLVKIGN